MLIARIYSCKILILFRDFDMDSIELFHEFNYYIVYKLENIILR